VTFNPRSLPGPHLQELPPERYWDLVYLNKAIQHEEAKPAELLRQVTCRLSRSVVWQLQAVLEHGLESMHELLEEHGSLSIESGTLWMGPSITEDSFLACVRLELACQPVGTG
jgi:hypothetical protein